MASESEATESILEQLLRGRGGGSFFPVLVGLIGRPPAEGETAPPPASRIVLVNPLTQGMVVLQGDTALMSEILSVGAAGRGGAPPASKASIEAMREVELGAADAEEECPVCLDGLWEAAAAAVAVVVKEMPCKHRFHADCVEKWLGMHGSCPVCRFQMPVEEAAKKGDGGGEGEEREEHEGDGRRRRLRREVWISIAIDRAGRRDGDQGGDGGEVRGDD